MTWNGHNTIPSAGTALLANTVGEHARLVDELLVLIAELSAKIRSYAESGAVISPNTASRKDDELAIKWLQTSLADLTATIGGLESSWLSRVADIEDTAP